MDLFSTIEQSALARLLRSSFIAYPVLSALHIAAIGGVLTSVLLLDLAVLRLVRAPARPTVQRFMRKLALAAFAGAVATGLLLFAVRATAYATLPVFLTKLGLIALAGVNFVVFLMLDARNGKARPSRGMRTSAILSILTWCGVLLSGRLIGFL